MLNFAGWHNHTHRSNYDYRDSIQTEEQLIDTALECGHIGVGFTDHAVLSGHIKAINYLEKKKKEIEEELESYIGKTKKTTFILTGRRCGKTYTTKKVLERINKLIKRKEQIDNFKLGLGCEIYLVNKEEVDYARENNQSTKFTHFILLAKDREGYELIKKISSKGWENAFTHRGLMRVPVYKEDLEKIVKENKGHLIASTACLGSEFAQMVMEYGLIKSDRCKMNIDKFLRYGYDLFGSDFYIEIQPSYGEEQIQYNQLALEIAFAYGMKAIVTTDAHYSRPKDAFAHSTFLKSQNAERETESFYASTYVMTVEEMREYFKYFNDDIFKWLMDNTVEIANKIVNFDLFRSTQVPDATIEFIEDRRSIFTYMKSLSLNHPYIAKYLYSPHEIDRILLQQIEVGLEYRKIQINDKVILDRLDEELKSLWEISEKLDQRLSSYYVLTEEIVELMWLTSLVGISRGSAGAFFIAYAIGITEINPITYNLPSWRHISSDRPELPKLKLYWVV